MIATHDRPRRAPVKVAVLHKDNAAPRTEESLKGELSSGGVLLSEWLHCFRFQLTTAGRSQGTTIGSAQYPKGRCGLSSGFRLRPLAVQVRNRRSYFAMTLKLKNI